MNKRLYHLLALLLLGHYAFSQNTIHISLDKNAAHLQGAFYVEKVPLLGKSLPEVSISNQVFSATDIHLADSSLQKEGKIMLALGLERKKTYALLKIPAFRKKEDGTIEQLNRCTISLKENNTPQEQEEKSSSNKNWRTTISNSVLSSGNWQKLAVGVKGVYKVDYDFVKNVLGQTSAINSAQIRLFGNGGTMLYEANAVQRYDDLQENALDMYDGGDGIFGVGDYFLFYANGPLEWQKDSANQQFHHRTNLYADSSYYFINFNTAVGKRMTIAPAASGSPNTIVSTYNYYDLHEKELVNLGAFGKIWWGETFGFSTGLNANQTFSFPVQNINDTVYYWYQLASAALGGTNSAKFTVQLNNNIIGVHDALYGISGIDGENPATAVSKSGRAIVSSTAALQFTINYEKYVSTAKGYLDFIEINTRRQLSLNTFTQLSFRDWRSVKTASIAQFVIESANNATTVWDVSDILNPNKINGTLSGSSFSFVQDAQQLKEYIAFDNSFLTPKYLGNVPNQDLHGLPQANYIIVHHPEMAAAAERLANFHRSTNALTVHTVPVDLIYNEFASGTKDISSIRDFVKMFYDRAGLDEHKMPQYLLLLGQASYDYKNIVSNSAKIVPTYETEESINATEGYCSDDFFAILDSAEDIQSTTALMDIGVGRIPATSAAQANAVVDKIVRYKSKEALGVWRLNNLYLGDDEDNAGNHLLDADSMFQTIENATNIYKAQKVYLDNMKFVSTPSGQRCPDANKIINDNMNKGTFLMNYSGHGSIYSLAHERVVTQDDYNGWDNRFKMPILITATCDFSRFDNPAKPSSGEKILLKGDGGAISLITTTQVVYASLNLIFNSAYLKTQFTKKMDGWNTFGDAFTIAKNSAPSTNTRKFALLGDPALVPNFPRYAVKTDSMHSIIDGVGYTSDSVKSLGVYRIYASVRDDAGNVMSNFNGKASISFFDKPQTASVKTANSVGGNREYSLQNNVIYKGNVTVKNGLLSFEFISPKDINYNFGKGKISYYADNGTIDAAGADTSFTVGGFADNVIPDEDAPIVRVFMNDSLFKTGGITGTNSVLYTIITDQSGINVTGSFVGHDLVGILDDNIEVPFVLNDYYETAANTYKVGFVNFPMNGLTDGMHSMRVKAWDVHNNSGEGKTMFEVINGQIVKLRKLYNYPNPFNDITHFVFEHNHPNEKLKATINIFNTMGGLMRTIEQEFTPTGSNSAEITWDGTGNGGEKLAPGIYPYRIRIATEKNIEDLGYQKVIFTR